MRGVVLVLLAFAAILAGPVKGNAQTSDDCTPAPAAIDFDDLSVGDEYVVSDTISSGAASLLVLPFDDSSEEFGTITVDPADPVGDAGGSGFELFVNNVLAEFSFPTGVDGISLRFDHGTGVGRVVLNEVPRDVNSGFLELDGQTVDEVQVSIEEGAIGDVMVLDGRIESFAIGGGELSIDDVVPRASCPDLAIVEVSTPRPVDRGSGIEFSILVENVGTAAADRTEVVVSSPLTEAVSDLVGPLDPGRSQRVVLTVPVPEELFGRTEEFTVTADPAREVNEVTFDNNQEVLPVRLPAPPERLAAPDLSLAVGSWAVTEDRLQIPVSISNEGNAPSRLTTVTVTGEGWSSPSADVRRLRPRRSVSITLDVVIPESARGNASELTITLDPDELVADLDRSNNVRQVTIEVPVSGDAIDTRAAWPAPVIGATLVVILVGLVIWRLLRPPPVPAVSARLRPGRTELVIIPKPDGGAHHTVRLVPHHDPGIQELRRGGKPR
jgi:CARDB